MADVRLVYRTSRAQIGTIRFDATLQETHQDSNDITDHPVEEGYNVADHVRQKPPVLTLSGVISNTPLSAEQTQRIVDAGGGVSVTTTTQTNQPVDATGYAQKAYSGLLDLMRGQLVRVVTATRSYDDMMIADITVPRDPRTGDALAFQIQLKQIRIVQNKTTRRVVAKRESKAQQKQKTGKQLPKEDTTRKSIAYSAAEKLGLLDKLGVR